MRKQITKAITIGALLVSATVTAEDSAIERFFKELNFQSPEPATEPSQKTFFGNSQLSVPAEMYIVKDYNKNTYDVQIDLLTALIEEKDAEITEQNNKILDLTHRFASTANVKKPVVTIDSFQKVDSISLNKYNDLMKSKNDLEAVLEEYQANQGDTVVTVKSPAGDVKNELSLMKEDNKSKANIVNDLKNKLKYLNKESARKDIQINVLLKKIGELEEATKGYKSDIQLLKENTSNLRDNQMNQFEGFLKNGDVKSASRFLEENQTILSLDFRTYKDYKTAFKIILKFEAIGENFFDIMTVKGKDLQKYVLQSAYEKFENEYSLDFLINQIKNSSLSSDDKQRLLVDSLVKQNKLTDALMNSFKIKTTKNKDNITRKNIYNSLRGVEAIYNQIK